MPYTLNGFGTRYYGNRDTGPDGSYVTTLWITALFVPVLPLASYRVRPTGKGINIIIHQSQRYRTVRVPMCWEQVRNVYLIVSPIFLFFVGMYFNAHTPSTSTQRMESGVIKVSAFDMLKARSGPITARSSTGPCGRTLKVTEKEGIDRLDLHNVISQLVDEGGFTNYLADDRRDVEQTAFSAYTYAYLTWNRPRSDANAELEKLLQKLQPTQKLSEADADQLQMVKSVVANAYELGLYDAGRNPCPF